MTATPAPMPASVDDELKLVPAQVTAVIRTVTPFLVGLVLTGLGWLLRTTGHASAMDDLPTAVREQLTTAMPVVLGSLYYVAARKLEKRWPRVPWLGSRAQPVYPQSVPQGQPVTVDPDAQVTVDATPASDSTPPSSDAPAAPTPAPTAATGASATSDASSTPTPAPTDTPEASSAASPASVLIAPAGNEEPAHVPQHAMTPASDDAGAPPDTTPPGA